MKELKEKRMFLKENVLEAALRRIRWVFDEFPKVIVGCSGGKDSTVCLELALIVAKERGITELPVMFLDQEAEWQSTIDYIRSVSNRTGVKMYWLQVPFQIDNATSQDQKTLQCWRDGDDWVRPKEANSIHENIMKCTTFHKMFAAFLQAYFNDTPAAYISGVRAEESPTRLCALTSSHTYKGETWGNRLNVGKSHYTFYPLYDWSYTDIWHAICQHNWKYNIVYDSMYQYGIALNNMRVSSVHHETSVGTLTYMQEIEPKTWDAIANRLSGVNTVGQMQKAWYRPKELPPMFSSWTDYRDHLLHNMIAPENVNSLKREFANDDRIWANCPDLMNALVKMQIAAILVNDLKGVKMASFRVRNHGVRRDADNKKNT